MDEHHDYHDDDYFNSVQWGHYSNGSDIGPLRGNRAPWPIVVILLIALVALAIGFVQAN